MKEHYEEYERKMKKTVAFFEEECATIRAGRANPAVLDKIKVDYYGVETPINQIGSISVPEPRMLLIQPWDMSVLKAVEKAIMQSDLGIMPSSDGRCIRLVFPPLTEERRKELVKTVHKKAEEARVAVRSIRRDAIEQFKKMEKNKEITEDDLKDMEEDIQELTDDTIKEIDDIAAAKEKEIMEV